MPPWMASDSLETKLKWPSICFCCEPSAPRLALTLAIDASSIVRTEAAELAEPSVVPVGMVMIGPPSAIVRTDKVMLDDASALAMNEMLVASEPSIRLVPLNVAFWTDWATCCRIEVKSWLSALRDTLSMEVSIAPTTFSRIWLSRSEMFEPAAAATSAIELARLRLSVTADSELRSERWLWAIE